MFLKVSKLQQPNITLLITLILFTLSSANLLLYHKHIASFTILESRSISLAKLINLFISVLFTTVVQWINYLGIPF